ncbi:G-protein coupled receptors family 1 profile domain-containing protein [Caenorhabditis elegans]|uniref:G-protein coupled receptors family 1 profile domain-containing protein n=1 Tax=Caenorhabditis elegans TaxID=6239 RepID=A0A486WYF3_CAEEL|nr:G-protein coupled receptors family 1 profile domain-containing protein [Caenorhabditis elegans]VGM69562.1 G-protein coupled receptors family 1 profile domain-containing protein [Caenorhabditis elegans]
MNETDDNWTVFTKLYSCQYRASDDSPQFTLWLDGPVTISAAIFSAIGTVYAIGFLRNGHLNRRMSAALYTLCLMDFMLTMTTVLFLSIEPLSILLFRTNIFYQHQDMILILYGIRNSFAMSSPMLVCYITYIRYRVVNNPLKFASHYGRSRKSISASKMSTAAQPSSTESAKFTISFPAEMFYEFHTRSNAGKRGANFRRFFRPFLVPILLVILCFVIHSTSYFEFNLITCFDEVHQTESKMLQMTQLRGDSYWYFQFKVALTMTTETLGPMLFISTLSLFTEYKMHQNVKERRRLFESQKRSRNTLVTEELKDKASKALAVFIVVKFLILRSLPTLIDLYEVLIENSINFGPFMTKVTRISDFLVILNSATNTLAYFGKVRFEKWLERRIRCRIVKKEAKEILSTSLTG